MKPSKKIFAFIAALCVSMSLAACGEKGTTDNKADTTISVTEGTVEETTAAENATEVSEESADTTEVSEESAETTADAEGGTLETIPEEGAVEDEASESHKAIVKAIEEVIAAREHASMLEVSDAVILKEFFLIDTADTNLKEVVVYQCPMSAVMSEIIVLQAEDVEAAKEILNNRRTKAIEQDAFYPTDVENAEASIVDTCGNYAYFVINGTAAEDAEQLNTLLGTIA